ncbi:cation transporter [Chroococcidiopsis thermalis]|uniref:cation transporter n=1 Tax=Chroococcidiopsis thermalis TaxID=54299 RepID=UPI0009030924|nr:cation transporter [Chroococcidiopsis thermalis]
MLGVFADAASSVGVMLAALAIYYLNWLWADASASLLVACLLSLGAVPLAQDSLEILMEYAPRCIDVVKVEAILRELKLSIGIHPPESPPVLLS